ncbi:O33 family O-antigen flippase [Escherichia coli]|nr:O33 family O-antigen flippase [Escherichia coli]EFC9703185.1 O33 family O-antigen flippase [Escherichia coli]EKQ4446476.1 O33 family O-antigen flippase [Escherichia coli]EKQ4541604.1 O33 family O-antigen flippase [Escherichia coli]MHU81151.1 O33 family O-antigen flippase [Escherichia coli]
MLNFTLIKNIFYLFIVQIINYVAPFLVLPYLSRVLSVDNFGLLMMIISASSIALIVTDYGFSLSGPLFVAVNKHNKVVINQYIGTIYLIKSVLISIIWFLFLFIYFISDNEITSHFSNILWLGVIITTQSFQPIWFFQGLEKMKNITFSLIISKSVYVILIFCLVKTNHVERVFLALVLSNVVTLVISNYLLYRNGYAIGTPCNKLFRDEIKNSFPFFLSRAAVGVYTSASTFIVGSFAGLNQAAVYSSAEKLYQAGQNALSPISQALYPYLARSGDKKTLYKFVVLFFILLCMICILSSYYSNTIVMLLFGNKYNAASQVLNVFLLSLVITFVSFNFGYPAFAAIKRVQIVNYTVVLGGGLQLLMIIILIVSEKITPLNMARSVLFTETLVLISRLGLYFYLILKNDNVSGLK